MKDSGSKCQQIPHKNQTTNAYPNSLPVTTIHLHTAATRPNELPVTTAAAAHTPEYAKAPIASTPLILYVCTKVLTPLTKAKVAVLLITVLVLVLYPQTLYQNVSVNVAVAGSKDAFLASSSDGFAATDGVNMSDFAAKPRIKVIGNKVSGVAECAASTLGISEKYVTRYVGR